MERRNMCDDCLRAISFKLKKEEILILEWMKKTRVFNQHLAVDKDKILSESKCGLTTFKINVSLSRLEVTSILETIIAGRNKKYYITDDGLRLLDIYKQDLIEKAQSVK